MSAFVVLGLFFPYQAKRLAWGMSPKWPILCWAECKTAIQSISWLFNCWYCAPQPFYGPFIGIVHLC